jgi:hypothetical protein
MKNLKFVGTWKLLSHIGQCPNEDPVYPFGENPFGRLMYDNNSNVSVFIMRRGRSKFVSDDPTGGTAEEIKEAFEGLLAYCGTYEIDEHKGTVTHYIEGEKFPNWEGTEQLRFFKLSGNQLTLNTPPILVWGKEWIFSLIWKLKI